MDHPDLAGIDTSPQARTERLRKFTARVEQDDAETIEFWRSRSAAQHAAAGAAMSDLAARMSAQTGHRKPPQLDFPPLSSLLRRRDDLRA